MRVIVAIDHPPARRVLAAGVRRAGVQVEECDDPESAAGRLRPDPPALIVLARCGPGADPLAAAAALRAAEPEVPLLLLGPAVAGGRGTAAGIRPAVDAELLAVVAARLRGSDGGPLRCGELELHPGRSAALWGGVDIGCTPGEYRILELLVLRQGSVVDGGELARASAGAGARSNVVAQRVSRLRTKLRALGAPELIETRRGLGYACAPP